MLHRAMTKRLLFASIFPLSQFIDKNEIPVNKAVEGLKPSETVRDRLRNMFYDENDDLTDGMQSIISATIVGLGAGFFIGGYVKARMAVDTFKEENLSTKFRSAADAQRQLQYKLMLETIRGGKVYAMRVGMFCFLFQSTSICMQAYRDKSGVINFTSAGALSGFLYKMNLGLKGAIAGSFVASILGTMYGVITHSMLYLIGFTMNDMYAIHNSFIKKRHSIARRQKADSADPEMKQLEKVYTSSRAVMETENENNKK